MVQTTGAGNKHSHCHDFFVWIGLCLSTSGCACFTAPERFVSGESVCHRSILSRTHSQVAFSIAAEGSAVDVRDFSHKDDHMVFP